MATRTARATVLTEGQFQRRILDLAGWRRWRAVHIRPLWQRDGKMVTPYEGDPGLPDLILARGGRIILAEIKNATRKATKDQLAWLAAAGPNGYLWRPADWPEIQQVLA